MADDAPVKVIKVAKVPEKKSSSNSTTLRVLATLCYYYPAYTLREARKLPYKHVVLMISQARRLQALEMYNLTQIAVAPHTKKFVGVKKLTKEFEKVAKNG